MVSYDSTGKDLYCRVLADIWINNQRLDRPFIISPNFFGPNRNFSIPEQKYFFTEYQNKIFIASYK